MISETADVLYKQSAYYDPEVERAIAWDDPEIGVDWPLPRDEISVSERDAQAPRLAEVAAELPFEFAGQRQDAPLEQLGDRRRRAAEVQDAERRTPATETPSGSRSQYVAPKIWPGLS